MFALCFAWLWPVALLFAATRASFDLATSLQNSLSLDVARIEHVLASPPLSQNLDKRVPLSTHDNTTTPLIDLQVFQPPIIPSKGSFCTVRLLTYDFGNSYGTPAVVPYKPPTGHECGETGKWAAISMNLTVKA